MRDNFFNKLLLLLPLVVIFVLCVQTAMQINQLKLIGDGEDNFKLSYHLAKHDVISTGGTDANGHLLPSNAREPLPIILSAVWMHLMPSLANANSPEEMLQGKKIVVLKLQNIVYMAALLVGIFCVFNQLLQHYSSKPLNLILASFGMLLCYACMHTVFANNLITEFHAEMLIIWFVWAWLRAWETGRNGYYLLTGLMLGGLVLTKAAFMYIGTASILFFMLFLLLAKYSIKTISQQGLILLIVIVCVAPWYVRNYIHFGIWEHTQRGPVVLLVRAYKNAMTHEEFKGAFYAYAPVSLKKAMKLITGFNANDRLTGGRLQRLTRFPNGDIEKRLAGDEFGAISYYIKATTHDRNVHLAYAKQNSNPTQVRVLADKAIKQEAIAKIKANIPAHLKAALVFAWRGAWPCNTVDGRWKPTYQRQPIWQEILPFFGLISLWGIFIIGLIKKQVPLVILSVLGVSAFSFYALATHFLPRYSEMLIALWVICLSYALVLSLSPKSQKRLH